MRRLLNRILRPAGYRISKLHEAPPADPAPLATFHSFRYLRHNARRLEHLASLGLPLAGKSVLEVGAGTGDHTHFFLDHDCQVVVTEARAENLAVIRQRYPQLTVRQLDMDQPQLPGEDKFDVIYCYGLLYHLSQPAAAIEFMAQRSRGLLLLETCVSYGAEAQINLCAEDPENPSQAWSGQGCRPTRPWVFLEIQKHFAHVYMPRTQPWREEFVLDWTGIAQPGLVRGGLCGFARKVNQPFAGRRNSGETNPTLRIR